jgi:hypothetical protein
MDHSVDETTESRGRIQQMTLQSKIADQLRSSYSRAFKCRPLDYYLLRNGRTPCLSPFRPLPGGGSAGGRP